MLCGASEKIQCHVNNYCHHQDPPIKVLFLSYRVCRHCIYWLQFISCDVKGVYSYTFCDFGSQFHVLDVDGEEPVELFIANITTVCI